MTELRECLADALMDGVGADERDAYQAVDVLLSLPGIAIVELPEADAGFVRFLAAQFQPNEARSLAAALLAAAAAAERKAK